jgi:uncharacterized membrane protein YqgA involved in biofilm formation
MKLSYVFIYQAVVAILLGLSGLVVPTTLGDIYGASLDKLAQTLAQYFGAAFITLGLISWFLRNAPESSERLWVVRSLAIGALLGLIPDFLAITNNLVNQLGWLNVALAVISTIGFGYYGFVKTSTSEPMPAR